MERFYDLPTASIHRFFGFDFFTHDVRCTRPLQYTQGEQSRSSDVLISLVTGLSPLLAIPARADTENNFRQWSLILVHHHLDNNWSASL
jgi:hypothetical protein